MAGRIDMEYHALRVGLKPAIRLSVEPGGEAEVERNYVRQGLVVARADLPLLLPSGPQTVLYVARTVDQTDALRAAEAPVLGTNRASSAVHTASVATTGRLLGYPPCCVARCVDRLARRLAARHLAQVWFSARDAWVPDARWELNDLLFSLHTHVISFEPCRYDCVPALSYARALLAVAASVDRDACDQIERTLRQALAVAQTGERAFVDFAADRIVVARPVGPADAGFAARLAGAKVDAQGGTTAQAVVVRFG